MNMLTMQTCNSSCGVAAWLGQRLMSMLAKKGVLSKALAGALQFLVECRLPENAEQVIATVADWSGELNTVLGCELGFSRAEGLGHISLRSLCSPLR
jgi:hypothetical protein